MKKLFLLLIVFGIELNAQVDVCGGMGINLASTTSLNDYINSINRTSLVSTFNSNIEFFGEVGYNYSKSMIIGLDYAFSIYSYTNSYSDIGNYKISYNQHSPTVMAYYVVRGDGYKFKFGGGLGLRYVLLKETLQLSTTAKDYSTLGFGILLKAEGNTAVSKYVYATIAVTLRLDYPGVPKSNGNSLSYSPASIQNVNVNAVSGGVRLGLLYTF
jgi:hypothetical protein